MYMGGNKWAVGITIDEYRFAILSFFTGVGFILIIMTFSKEWLSTRIWLVSEEKKNTDKLVRNGINCIYCWTPDDVR